MNMAYEKKWPLYLSTKNTILKKYDGRYEEYSVKFSPCLILFDTCNIVTKLSAFSSSCEGSRTYSKRFMKASGSQNLRKLEYGAHWSYILFTNNLFASYAVNSG